MTASVSGKVVDILGAGHAGVTIDDVPVASQSDGSFFADSLKPGSHSLRVGVPGFKSERLDFDLEVGQELALPPIELKVADFACGSSTHPERKFLPKSVGKGNLVGIVTVGDGLRSPVVGIAGIEVLIEGPDIRTPVLTDREGRYRFDGLLPGQYTVVARRRGFYEEREVFRVEEKFESIYPGYLGLTLCLDGTCKAPRPVVQGGCE